VDKSLWQGILATQGEIPVHQSLEGLTAELLEWLRSDQSDLRDEIAYTLLATWIFDNRYSPAALRDLVRTLEPRLSGETVFERSFAVLLLGNLVEHDATANVLEVADLERSLELALNYLLSETDERGFVPGHGWAHALAHTADWLASLASHPKLENASRQRILTAVTTRLQTSGFVFGQHEPSRLATAALRAIQHGVATDDWLTLLETTIQVLRRAVFKGGFTPAQINLEAFLSSLALQLRQLETPPVEVFKRIAALLEASGFASQP
jgi:Protein of unknown function (DUF2785)